jgi:hypothetical protein
MICWYFSAVTVSEENKGLQSVYEISQTNRQFSWNVVALHETSRDFHCSRTWNFVNLHIHLHGTGLMRQKNILQDICTISYKLSEPSAVTHPFVGINFFKFMTDFNSALISHISSTIDVVLLLYIVNKINWDLHFERNETTPVQSTTTSVTDKINYVSEFVMPLLWSTHSMPSESSDHRFETCTQFLSPSNVLTARLNPAVLFGLTLCRSLKTVRPI